MVIKITASQKLKEFSSSVSVKMAFLVLQPPRHLLAIHILNFGVVSSVLQVPGFQIPEWINQFTPPV